MRRSNVANGTDYALTGGFFSRSPANIERIKAQLEAGNVYINRPCTGAIVGRHPFGGFKMSGGGTKAGGEDYLLQLPHSARRDRKRCTPRAGSGKNARIPRRISLAKEVAHEHRATREKIDENCY